MIILTRTCSRHKLYPVFCKLPSGNEAERHHLESLGFVEGASVCILSAFFGCYVVRIKDSKIGIGKDLAKMIIVQAE